MRYERFMRRSLVPLITSRIMPYCGITLLLALVAHKHASDLALISYVLAIFSVVAVMLSMSLGATGNLIAEHSDDDQEKTHLFRGGFSVSLVMAVVSLLIGFVILELIADLPGAQMNINKVHSLAVIYLGAIPLLVINTFLHFFHEANGDARVCSIIRLGVTVCSGLYVGLASFAAGVENFIYWAMGYFLFGEALLLLCLLWLSWKRNFDFCPMYCKRTVRNVIRLGFPIAFGLAGQKLYFYLLNERLAAEASARVAQLSVYMSVVGLFMIPVVAYCQAHSLYISRHVEQRLTSYGKGQLGLLMLIVLLLCALLVVGHSLFFWLGEKIVAFNRDAFISVGYLLVSGSVLSLSTSHLRGLRDTLAPQLMMNLVMLSVLVPIIYFVSSEAADIHFYLRLQSAGLFTGFILLQLRIWHMHVKTVKPATV